MGRPSVRANLVSRLSAMIMALAFLIPTHNIRQAQALEAGVVNALSMAAVAASVTNVASSGIDCACKAGGGSSCPKYPWATCAVIGLTAASLIASMMQSSKNKDSANHFAPNVTNSNDGGPKTPSTTSTTSTTSDPGVTNEGVTLPNKPSPMDFGEFCSKTPEFCNDCAKSGNYAGCKPEMILPEDFPKDTLANMPEMGSALSAIEQAMELVNSAPLMGQDDGHGDAESGFADADGGGTSDALVVKKTRPGKMDGTGLDGASMWGMDMVDEKSGAKLTLWQRATRRYYGAPELKRLNFLARAEYVRAKAIIHAKAKLNQPKVTQAAASAVVAPLRTPASADQSAPVVPVKNSKY